MSISDYLNNLSTEQLQYAVDEASSIIENRNKQQKTPIYIISDQWMNHYAIHVGEEDMVIDAAIHLLESQRKDLKEQGVEYGKIQVNIDVKYTTNAVGWVEDLKWKGI